MAFAIRTPRLLLREWRDDDLGRFMAMAAEPEQTEYLPPGEPAWVERARAHWRTHGFGPFVVELPGVAPFIGVVGLDWIRWSLPFTPAVQAGWRLSRAYWERGYTTEAARASLDDGFSRLGLDEIVAYTTLANRRSWMVMERLGMRRDFAADFDHPNVPEGSPIRRHILYRLRRPAP